MRMMRSLMSAASVGSVQGFRTSTQLTMQQGLAGNVGRRATVGERCAGGSWLFSDGCPRERVTNLEGNTVEVALSCFRVGGRKPDKLADWNEVGACFIPKGSQCDEDDQCRNGTSCMLDAGGDAYTCQEVAADHMFDTATAAEVAAHVAAIIRSMAERLSNSELVSGVRRAPGGFMDDRSGAMSPFVAKPALAKQALAAVAKSFVSATVKGKDAASRSGSLFVISGDGRFLAKSVREQEYEEFADRLIGPLARHADLAGADCQPGSSDACWAEAALNRTCLNIPVLAFVHNDRYWVVLPASAELRGLVISRSAAELQPLGAATYYDVKPLWAKSKARLDFMQKLTELGMNPMAQAASTEMRAQWAALRATVERDIDFVTRESSDDAPLIDYSLLFEVYTPGRRVDVSGRHCMEAPSCFENNPASCQVLCVSIIDFFTTFTFHRWLESWWKQFKFHDYAQKAKDLLACPFSQRFPLSDGEGDGLTVTELNHSFVEVRVKVKWGKAGLHKDSTCKPYMDMACETAVGAKVFAKDECMPWWAQPRFCDGASCSFQAEPRYLDQCGAWMREWCQKAIADYNALQRPSI